MRTYVAGRSPYADIVIAEPSVAEHHAEIVEASDGRLFVSDCGTSSGTWRLARGDGRSVWEPIRQAYAAREDLLRFGDYQCVLSELLSALGSPDAGAPSSVQGGVRVGKGRVERDPATGEVVRRRP
jgi:pSer/pThr/pTyr-binding forkhead associated (FHA) protein